MTAIDGWIFAELGGIAVMVAVAAATLWSLRPPDTGGRHRQPNINYVLDDAATRRLLADLYPAPTRRIELDHAPAYVDGYGNELPPLIVSDDTNPRGIPTWAVDCIHCWDLGFIGGCASCDREAVQ